MNANLEFKVVMRYTLIAGIIAVIVNNTYRVIFEAVSGYSMHQWINVATVTAASFAPIFLAGIFFFILGRYFISPRTIFVVVVVLWTIASLYGPFASQLPDGSATPPLFTWLTFPMHIVAGLLTIIIIPLAARGTRDTEAELNSDT